MLYTSYFHLRRIPFHACAMYNENDNQIGNVLKAYISSCQCTMGYRILNTTYTCTFCSATTTL